MAQLDGVQQFRDEVLAAELDEVRKRRKNIIEQGISSNENTEGEDLVGLACSGGGIRSASFCLGVIQYLIQQKFFNKIDYLSTVSGGGYTGSCISALTKGAPGREALLAERAGGEEPAALNHIRNYSKYLDSTGPLSAIRIPVLIVEGAIRSFFTFLPIIILAVFFTEVFFEVTGRFNSLIQWAVPVLGITPMLAVLVVRPIFFNRLDWRGRDKGDRILTNFTLVALLSIVSIPFLILLRNAVDLDSYAFFSTIKHTLSSNSYLSITGSLALLGILVFGIYKFKGRAIVLIVSVLAPLALFCVYVYLCIAAINSPYVEHAGLHDAQREAILAGEDIESTTLATSILLFNRLAAKTANGLLPPIVDPGSQNESLGVGNCSCATAQIQLPGYEAMGASLDAVFKQKQLDFSAYCLSGLSTERLQFCRTTIVNPASAFGGYFQRYLTTQAPHLVTLSLAEGIFIKAKILVFEELRILHGHAEWWLYLLGFLLQCYNWMFININRFSLHSFYRDRLSRTFLISGDDDEIRNIDKVKLSELKGPESTAPYHIINTALNLQGSSNPQLRSRKTVSFILTKLFCGSDMTGYCQTKDIENEDSHFDLGAAMAISAAAASPNMGTVGNSSLSFIMTLLNIRLNYWLPNPALFLNRISKKALHFKSLGLSYLMSEALSTVNESTPYVNCSDGGHIENLGVYELLRRRCKTIICIDGEADPLFNFDGLTTLQRYAEIDLGIVLDIDVNSIKPVDGLSSLNSVLGRISYPDGSVGTLIYLKLSFNGTEPEYLHSYRQRNTAFPHESTGDQSFDETQFEVYRALGSFVAKSADKHFHHAL